MTRWWPSRSPGWTNAEARSRPHHRGSAHRPGLAGLQAPGPGAGSDADGEDLRRIVAACAAAAERLGIHPPAPVWTPPLPDVLPLVEAEGTGGDLVVGQAVLGLVDLPHEQRRQRLGWHPKQDGHLAIAGASRTGRTSTLLTVAAGLARRWSPADLHLHVIDAGRGALCRLADLPHTGTAVTADQPRLVARLVERLGTEVADRRRRGTHATDPALVLLIDGWEALAERLEDIDHGRPVDQLLALVRDGESVGLRAIVAGGRGVLLSRVAAVVGHRLMLRPNDPTDLLLAGIAPSALPSSQPPGRAVRSTDGTQVQIALPPSPEELTSDAARRWPSWADLARARRALRLLPLPDVVDAADLLWAPPPGRWALIGRGGDDAGAVGIDLAVDRFALVAGPPGSGRSTTLVTMARSLHAAGAEVVVVCTGALAARRRSVAGAATRPARPGVHASEVAELSWRARRCCSSTTWTGCATTRSRRCCVRSRRTRPRQASSRPGTTSVLLAGYRGLAGVARAHRTGVLLRPESASDGEVLGIRAELDDRSPAGRGLLVVRGRQTPVQVATCLTAGRVGRA